MPESMATPVLTDRHGFLLFPGNTVLNIADESTFVVTDVQSWGASPVVYLLKDDNGCFVDASLVMLTDAEQARNGWKRASFCEVCFNHFNCGVSWFKSPFFFSKSRCSVYSACGACFVNVDRSIALPEIAWVS